MFHQRSDISLLDFFENFLGIVGFTPTESGVILENVNRPFINEVDKMNVPFGRRRLRWSTIASPQGNGERSIFEERVVDGVRSLVITGKENVKEFIETSKNDTLISTIMRRFEQGDINALSRVQGFYGDVTSMPSNLAEAQNILINLENQFNSFPADVRKKFDNSFDKYVQEVSNLNSVDDFNTLFNLNLNVTDESEVTVNDKE